MTREETVKFIYDILKKHSVKVNEVDVIPVSSCIALVDDLIEHESNLLKEFVSYLKGIYAKDYDDKAKIADLSLGRGRKDNYWFYSGQQTALQRIIDLLDKDLENFLKERDSK